MKKIIKSFTITAFIGLAAFINVNAQCPMCSQSNAACSYDTATVEKISGEIINMEKITNQMMKSYGVHLIVKNISETIEVHLGPGWFIEDQEETLAKGDKVIVYGSRIICDNKPSIITREIKRGGYTLLLRDENGIPLWQGQGRKMQ